MESIAKYTQALLQKKTSYSENMVVPMVQLKTGLHSVRYNADGQAYISAYCDSVPTAEQVSALLIPFGELFNYSNATLEVFAGAILDSKITLFQLRDALKNIYKTFTSKNFGKPKPADIIVFDKQNQEEPIFLALEMCKMCEGIINLYYGSDKYSKLFPKTRDTLFKQLCDVNGIPLREKKPTHPSGSCQCYFMFTDKGWQYKDDLIWCLKQNDVKRIACKNARK